MRATICRSHAGPGSCINPDMKLTIVILVVLTACNNGNGRLEPARASSTTGGFFCTAVTVDSDLRDFDARSTCYRRASACEDVMRALATTGASPTTCKGVDEVFCVVTTTTGARVKTCHASGEDCERVRLSPAGQTSTCVVET